MGGCWSHSRIQGKIPSAITSASLNVASWVIGPGLHPMANIAGPTAPRDSVFGSVSSAPVMAPRAARIIELGGSWIFAKWRSGWRLSGAIRIFATMELTPPMSDLITSSSSARPLVSPAGPDDSGHKWVGKHAAGQHNGLVDARETPCVIALDWRRGEETVHVGTFALNLRELVAAGIAREERPGKIRVKFMRGMDGSVALRLNRSAPSLVVGSAVFR